MNSFAAYIVAFALFYFCLTLILWSFDEGVYWRRVLTGMRAYRTNPWEIITFSFIAALFAAMAQGLANFFLFLMTL